MSGFDCDLLVVGLGPVGDVLAGLAAQEGLSVIAVDREPAPFPLPRAAVFDHEIMRVFQALGVAERIAPLCRTPDRYQFKNAAGALLLDFELGRTATVSGWNDSYLLHQPAVEQVLRERLTELGVDVRLGTSFSGLTQDEQGVTAMFEGPAGLSQISARWLAGCDGGRSPVREWLGIGLSDYQFDEPWLVVDALCDDPGDLPIACMQIADPKRPVTYLAMSPPRFRWEFMMKPHETAEDITSEAAIRELLAPWNCLDRIRIERKAVYRFHGLVAAEWRRGRVLLAGDAAHQMPPFAGQGMCSGVRDAINLAWKLAAVTRGEAAEALLDTYQEEREPHVRAIIETAIAMGKVVCMQDEAAAAQRDRDMIARKQAGEQDVQMAWPDLIGGCIGAGPGAGALFPQSIDAQENRRLDDAAGPGAWIVGDGVHGGPDLRAIDLSAPDWARFAPPLRHWLAEHRAAAAIVRPDRHVFATGAPGEIKAAWARAVTSGRS